MRARRDRHARVGPARDRLTVDVLHHEIGLAVVGDTAIEQRGDVRVIEVGQHLPFGAEALHGARNARVPMQEFDRDAFLELLVGALVLRRPCPCRQSRSSACHAPGSELADQASVKHRRRSRRAQARFDRSIERRGAAIVSGEQCEHFVAQCWRRRRSRAQGTRRAGEGDNSSACSNSNLQLLQPRRSQWLGHRGSENRPAVHAAGMRARRSSRA
jgi:hypothetical protein